MQFMIVLPHCLDDMQAQLHLHWSQCKADGEQVVDDNICVHKSYAHDA